MARTLAMFTDTPSASAAGLSGRVQAVERARHGAAGVDRHYQNHAHFTTRRFAGALHGSAGRSPSGDLAWLLMSDVCKHCADAGCLDACPRPSTGTEFGTVNINQDTATGCRYCVSSCPFGVVSFKRATGPPGSARSATTRSTTASARLRKAVLPSHPVRVPRRARFEGRSVWRPEAMGSRTPSSTGDQKGFWAA